MRMIKSRTCFLIAEINAAAFLEMAVCVSADEVMEVVDAWRDCGCPRMLSASQLMVYSVENGIQQAIMTL